MTAHIGYTRHNNELLLEIKRASEDEANKDTARRTNTLQTGYSTG